MPDAASGLLQHAESGFCAGLEDQAITGVAASVPSASKQQQQALTTAEAARLALVCKDRLDRMAGEIVHQVESCP